MSECSLTAEIFHLFNVLTISLQACDDPQIQFTKQLQSHNRAVASFQRNEVLLIFGLQHGLRLDTPPFVQQRPWCFSVRSNIH